MKGIIVPAQAKRMVREYESLGYALTDNPRIPGALALVDDEGDIVYIKTAQPFIGVSFANRTKK